MRLKLFTWEPLRSLTIRLKRRGSRVRNVPQLPLDNSVQLLFGDSGREFYQEQRNVQTNLQQTDEFVSQVHAQLLNEIRALTYLSLNLLPLNLCFSSGFPQF